MVSKLFRAYGLYNGKNDFIMYERLLFQSSFELTGYITRWVGNPLYIRPMWFQSSFELTGYITNVVTLLPPGDLFQSSFELTGYITSSIRLKSYIPPCFKALSSLRVI